MPALFMMPGRTTAFRRTTLSLQSEHDVIQTHKEGFVKTGIDGCRELQKS
jgi:hypothetical protein